MATSPDARFQSRLVRLSAVLGLGIALTGSLVLGGWAFDIPMLTSLLPHLATMKANTAAAFVLAGGSLWLLAWCQRTPARTKAWLARGLAMLVGLVGLLTMAEYGFGRDLGIDQLMFFDSASAHGSVPGRMALMTSVNFTLLAAALLLLDVETREGRRPSNWLALARALQRSHDRRMALVQTSDWQQAILNSADFTMISTDAEGTIRTVNAGAVSMLGYTADELVDKQTPAILHGPAEVVARAKLLSQELGRGVEPQFEVFVAKARRSGGSDENDWTYIRKDGSRFPVRLSITPMTDAQGNLTGFLGIGKDIGAQRLAEEKLRGSERRLAASEARLRAITDAVPALISYIDFDRRFRFTNATHAQWLGRPVSEIIGRRLDEVYEASTYESMQPHLDAALAGRLTTFEFLAPALGRYIRGTFLPDAGQEDQVTGVYCLIEDITRQKAVEAELRQLTQVDSLTGLANRSRFNDKLAEAIARSERSGLVLALMFLDLDRFKDINDTFGHRAGDQALQEFALRLSGSVRATDTVARLAGDEFVVILESLRGADEAEVVAAKLVAVMRRPFQIGGRLCQFSASIGIALRRPAEVDGTALLARADAALYQAKSAGRGDYVIGA